MDFSTVKGNPSAEEGVNMSIRSSFRRQCSTDLMGYEKEKFAENQKAREGFQDENDEHWREKLSRSSMGYGGSGEVPYHHSRVLQKRDGCFNFIRCYKQEEFRQYVYNKPIFDLFS